MTLEAENIRVLLVDDDEDDYLITKYLFDEFKDNRYKLEWTTDGLQALNAMKSGEYDIYLLDLRLGEHDGLRILQEAIAGGCTEPILLLTGQTDKETDIKAMEVGAADYLVKGEFDSQMLERVIRYSIQHFGALEKMHASEERFRSVIKSASDAIFLVDSAGGITLWNDAAENIFGYTEQEILGKSALTLMGEKYARRAKEIGPEATLRQFAGPLSGKIIEAIARRKDNSEFPIEMSGSVWETKHGEFYTAIVRDITERQKAEAERDRLYNFSNDLLATIGFDGALLHFNPAWEKILGYPKNELLGKSVNDLTHKEDREKNCREAKRLISGHDVSYESRLLCKDGSFRWISWNASPFASEEISYVVGRNITERKAVESVLEHNALFDTLTNLPNRTQFMNHLQTAIEKYEEDSTDVFAMLFLDLDRFKIINDGLGHLIGDKLLVTIAERIRKVLRPGDVVARLGGDEFTLLIHNVQSVSDATTVAERIQRTLSFPFKLDNYEVSTSASIGIIVSDKTKRTPEDFLRDADSAMYRAKESGKARYAIFDQEMLTRNMNWLHIESDLRKAIEREELRVVYQPIVNLQTGELQEFEALIRWEHPQRGLISPLEFIEIAEETGLIIEIGKWILEEACRQTKHWQKTLPNQEHLTISVNLSSKQLMHPSLVPQVVDVLAKTGLNPQFLKLEVTESIVMENAEAALTVINDLIASGIAFSSDDFGTGYSSLSYLHKFPFRRIKIDRSFIGKMDTDVRSEAIVRTILMLAENLGFEVVAEGIENINQLKKLQTLGCAYGQGYLFSKAVNEKDAERLLTLDSEFESLTNQPGVFAELSPKNVIQIGNFH